jgi:hypothetical protein
MALTGILDYPPCDLSLPSRLKLADRRRERSRRKKGRAGERERE